MTGVNDFGRELNRLRKARYDSQAEAAAAVSPKPLSGDYWGRLERGTVDLETVEYETLWKVVCIATDDPSQRARLMDLAGGKHREIFAATASAGMADRGAMPSPHEVIEQYDKIDSRGKSVVRAVLEGEEAKFREQHPNEPSAPDARRIHPDATSAGEGA